MLNKEQKERYRRQIAVVGEDGQEKIGSTRLLIAGAGGLGCTAALFAAMAGFGTIRIIDPDCIDETNLNRQLLYREADIGRPKADTAAKALHAINSFIDVEPVTAAIGTARPGTLSEVLMWSLTGLTIIRHGSCWLIQHGNAGYRLSMVLLKDSMVRSAPSFPKSLPASAALSPTPHRSGRLPSSVLQPGLSGASRLLKQ